MSKMEILNEQEIVKIIEVNQPIEILLSIPKVLNFEPVHGIEQVSQKISELLPFVDSLAEKAFISKEKNYWDAVQKLLYLWNYRDLTRHSIYKNDNFMVEQYLKKVLVATELENMPKHNLDCANDFTPERAVQELADKAQSHRINKHPLLETMSKNGLSKNMVRSFLENYYVNNRVFHLFIATLSLFSPLERRTELANNFYDEMGSGDSAMAHPVLFLKNFDTIGKPASITPLPEALSLMNAKTFAAFLSGDYYYGMGGFGYIELTMPEQMKKILSGLGKSGLPRQDLEFWETHITIDMEHGKTWFAEMLHLIKDQDSAKKCLLGGMNLLDARATMYDGILRSSDEDY